MATSSSLAACLINISEGRRHEVVWAVVRAACRAIERPLKGSEGSSHVNGGSQLGKAVVLNTFVDKEYNRKEPIFDFSISLIVRIIGAW